MRLHAPPRSLAVRHFVETYRIRPPLAGFFNARLWPPSLRSGQTAQFGPPSLRRKFPFLAPKSCGVESFALPLSARQIVFLDQKHHVSGFDCKLMRLQAECVLFVMGVRINSAPDQAARTGVTILPARRARRQRQCHGAAVPRWRP